MVMNPNSIARWWVEYAEKILPMNASRIQRTETRRAFYAGANAMLTAQLKGVSPDKDVQDSDLALMDSLHAELHQFAEDVKAGRA